MPHPRKREDVTDSPYGPNAFRMLRVVLDGRAYSGNVHVNTSVKRFQSLAANRFHQLITGLHASGALREYLKQSKLVAGHLADLAVEPRFARIQVDHEPAEIER